MSDSLDRIRKLLEDQGTEAYSRYDGKHPYDVYLGVDRVGTKKPSISDGRQKRACNINQDH